MSQFDWKPHEITTPPTAEGDSAAVSFRSGRYSDFYKSRTHNSMTTSSNSSPTTTMSTVDDSSATEPSPESSPESPPPPSYTKGVQRPRSSDDSGVPFFDLQKQHPPRKGRNLKNLAVNTSRHTPRAASTNSLPVATPQVDGLSSLSSPVFVRPPAAPKTRKKPNSLGLTLLTPATSKTAPQEVKIAIPPTPGITRPNTLRHFQSSPSLPLFPVLGLPAGMRPANSNVPLSLATIMSPSDRQGQNVLIEEEEPNFDVPLSREVKAEAYPEGPICVYEPLIDLYLEPTAEQCRKYDVVMNVASEVRNPLDETAAPDTSEPDIRIDGGGGIQYAPRRLQATTSSSAQAKNGLPESPTTPKATPLSSAFPEESKFETGENDPEYVHIKWEHNSDIVPDLLRLVKLMDDRVKHSKRILVHCQCGVSRSASLVVAYGLYKDPTMTVQEAYDAVKSKSKWIGPNMNLIMQLQEFRTSLARGGLLSSNRGLTPVTPSSAFSEWRGPFSAHLADTVPRSHPLSASATTATQASGTDSQSVISPGPSSAPSGLSAESTTQAPNGPSPQLRAVSAAKPSGIRTATSAYVDPAGHVVPVLKVMPDVVHSALNQEVTAKPVTNPDDQDCATPTETPASSRSADFAMAPLLPSKEVDSADKFGLMSPMATEFSASPFDRSTLLATLGMGSVQREGSMPNSIKPTATAVNSKDGVQPGVLHDSEGNHSSPSRAIHEPLHSLPIRYEAAMPRQDAPHTASANNLNEALLSPRAEEFTKNPFALPLPPPTTSTEGDASRASELDPRSPPQVGVSPITRNILDAL